MNTWQSSDTDMTYWDDISRTDCY